MTIRLLDTDPPTMAIAAGLISPNEADSNGEPTNVVDGLYAIARAVHRLADVIGERVNSA
jgi:hypothetical protein